MSEEQIARIVAAWEREPCAAVIGPVALCRPGLVIFDVTWEGETWSLVIGRRADPGAWLERGRTLAPLAVLVEVEAAMRRVRTEVRNAL